MEQARSGNRALCLWLPQWPLQRLRLARPALRRRELALYEEYRRGCFRIVACSGGSGIAVGMPLAEAAALGSAQLEEHDPRADQAALLQLAACCEQFSPIAGIEPPDNLCLDVTGLVPLFGSEELLVRQILREFHRRGLQVRAAVADTLGAAWAVAHFGGEFPVIVPAGQAVDAIAGLPVAALRLPEDAVQLLAELGVREIGQLLALERGAVASRFDRELLRRLDQATGRVPETIASRRPPPDVVAETQLEYPAAERQRVDHVVARLIEQVAATLAKRQQGAIQLECQLQCEAGETVRLLVGLFRASAQAAHLLELARMQLERTALPGPVTGARLSVLASAPLQSWQPELFEPSRRESRRQVELLVDRLSNRLGREAVVRAELQPEAQPELAFRYRPLAGVLPQSAKPPRGKLPQRPLLLENEPAAVAVAPDGPPGQFQRQGWQRVARAWGPERIQTGWWRGRYVQRDYYRVETTAGQCFWLFRRLHDGQWFLHGVFD